MPNVGRFLIRPQGPVLVDRANEATDADVRCFRDESVAAALAVLRGELVLRAASVAIAGQAVVLCGVSAAGKSTLAAALALRGHAVLADAVTVISRGSDGSFVVVPVAPDPVLWPDSADELGLTDEPSRIVRPALAKSAYRLGPAPVASPPAAVVHLSIETVATEPALEPLTGTAKLKLLMETSWYPTLVDALGLSAQRFRACAELAATVPFLRLTRPLQGAAAASLVGFVEDVAA